MMNKIIRLLLLGMIIAGGWLFLQAVLVRFGGAGLLKASLIVVPSLALFSVFFYRGMAAKSEANQPVSLEGWDCIGSSVVGRYEDPVNLAAQFGKLFGRKDPYLPSSRDIDAVAREQN